MTASEREGMRLQKYLSRAGVASRREAEALMQAGRIRVNGRVVREPGTRVDPESDVVEVNGRRVEGTEPRWILFHKPPACLTTRSDARGRPTIYHRLPPEMRGLRYVGRLDWATEGLLLLTNQGELANALLHPSGGVEREYRAWVEGVPSPTALRRLREGVQLDDGPARAEKVKVLKEEEARSQLRLVLREGRKREVRRLLEAVGHPVLYLRRVRFGPLSLGKLPRGGWRELEGAEVKALERAVREGARRREAPARGRGRPGGEGARKGRRGGRGSTT